jgi:hypothetical protein
MAAIAELIDAWRGRRGLGVILGLDEAVHRPFADEAPERIDAAELAALLPGADRAVLQRLLDVGILEADGDELVTRTPGLVRAGARLAAAGMPVDQAVDEGIEIWNATDALARRMVDAFVRHVWTPFAEAGMPEDEWPGIIDALRDSGDIAVTGVLSALGGALRRATDAVVAELGEPLGTGARQSS